ncbi:purine-cytosine permease family protein [Mycobacterium sp. NPDC003449]
MTSPSPDGAGISGIETRSIDWIPLSERHGKAWHQGPFWFNGGFVLPSMLIGFIGPGLGLGLGWSLLAVVTGMAFGTVFMALHANQGPRLGLPQMIQSRAQFGARGAIFPMLVAVCIYVGYNVFQFILVGEAISVMLPGGKIWYVVCAVVATAIAIIGHDLLHTVQRWSSYVILVMFAIFTVVAIIHLPTEYVARDGFQVNAFLLQFAAAGGYQISYAIYVSDYSRYLPQRISDRALIGWTFVGGTAGAAWLACLGTLLSSYIPDADPIAGIHSTGNALFAGFGVLCVLATLPPLIGTSAVNGYGAMLTGATIIDGIRHVQPGRKLRVVGLLLAGAAALLLSVAMPANYLDAFTTFIHIMGYCLVPWTAVNLMDFYVVRRGRYNIADILNPSGRYGQWAWRGLTAYFAGFVAMVPFFSLSFYEGPVARVLGGADFSFVIGLIVSGLVYLALCGRDAGGPLMSAAARHPGAVPTHP